MIGHTDCGSTSHTGNTATCYGKPVSAHLAAHRYLEAIPVGVCSAGDAPGALMPALVPRRLASVVTGDDPAGSVVDATGKVHGMDNLYVVDGSVLPRSSRVNPSLTIYAWSLRVSDLLTRLATEAHDAADLESATA